MKKVLILAAFALVAACGKSAEVKNTAPVNAPANTQTNTQANVEPVKEETYTSGVNPRADLISSTQKLQKVPYWSAVVTSATDLDVRLDMEYVAPDRFRIKKPEGELIVIGAMVYSNETGKWEKVEDAEASVSIRDQITAGIAEGVKSLKDVEVVGKEKFNNREATVYSHKVGDATIKIWIETATGLQLKNELETNVTGELMKQTTVYDYDTPVKIEAPKLN
jgi:hypothetical protein